MRAQRARVARPPSQSPQWRVATGDQAGRDTDSFPDWRNERRRHSGSVQCTGRWPDFVPRGRPERSPLDGVRFRTVFHGEHRGELPAAGRCSSCTPARESPPCIHQVLPVCTSHTFLSRALASQGSQPGQGPSKRNAGLILPTQPCVSPKRWHTACAEYCALRCAGAR